MKALLLCVTLIGVAAFLSGCGSSDPSTATPTQAPTEPIATTTDTTGTSTTTTTTSVSPSTTCELDTRDGTWCMIAPHASDDTVKAAVQYVCQKSGAVDCTACASKDPLTMANWAFNTYFHKKIKHGAQSCNFSGAAALIYPPFSSCKPSLAHGTWCQPKPGTSRKSLLAALEYVCSKADCTPIHDGGACVFVSEADLQMKCEWAFDAYYHAHESQGAKACNLGGAGQLVKAPCGDYNIGNPQTGRGFAYPNASCAAESTASCGCIQDSKTSAWTGCHTCVTKDPRPDKCEYPCPWLKHPLASESDLVV